jgi:hypothetical protein
MLERASGLLPRVIAGRWFYVASQARAARRRWNAWPSGTQSLTEDATPDPRLTTRPSSLELDAAASADDYPPSLCTGGCERDPRANSMASGTQGELRDRPEGEDMESLRRKVGGPQESSRALRAERVWDVKRLTASSPPLSETLPHQNSGAGSRGIAEHAARPSRLAAAWTLLWSGLGGARQRARRRNLDARDEGDWDTWWTLLADGLESD